MIWLLLLQFVLCQAMITRLSCTPAYNLTDFIKGAGIQFCTIVEIGRGFCSIFAEMRNDPTIVDLKPGSFIELYLGTCLCQTMMQWDFCSRPLKSLRPYECSFQKEDDFTTQKSRVHRKLCDLTLMAEINSCECRKKLSYRTLYPIEGFPACYRNPLPTSICSTHSVCGVYKCSAYITFGSLTTIKCDENCFGGQPFCEEPGILSSLPVVVTSVWSNWTCVLNDDLFEISESICLEKDLTTPAFDCLGPRSLCCTENYNECFCKVTLTPGEMKATRFIIKGYPESSFYWQHKMKLKMISKQLGILERFEDYDTMANKQRKHKKYSFIKKIKGMHN